jgi:hypothetical protein
MLAGTSVPDVEAARSGEAATERIARTIVTGDVNCRLGPARPSEAATERIARTIVTGDVDRRHVVDAAGPREAPVKRIAHAVDVGVGRGLTRGIRPTPEADADDRHGNDGEDCEPGDAETRCGPSARGRCGDLRCHDGAP